MNESKKTPKKIMWRIFMFLIVFCLIMLSILWILETALLEPMYQRVRRSEMKKAIILVEENINNPNLENIIADLQHDSEIIVSSATNFIPPNSNMQSERKRGIGRDKMRQAITETREFKKSDGTLASYTFYAIISPVNATISTIKLQLYYVTGIMIFLSAVLAFAMARIVSKPIEKLNESAKVLATGNYDVSFSGEGYREIHELSDTLNYTASELSKVEGLRRELMANISHDLRTPLALIYSYAEMMHDFPDEVNEKQTEVIMTEASRLSLLVDDIFDVSQLESGNMELKRKRYNLTESIERTVNRVSELVRSDGYRLNFIKEQDVFVDADEVKITQAFYNLLINAVHYSGDDKAVNVRQIVIDNMVKIEVMDNGAGIEEESIPYIWDRYYKTDKEHRRAIVGTGLGLSIVKRVIEMHDGKYGVISESGKGSIFWFSIKAAN